MRCQIIKWTLVDILRFGHCRYIGSIIVLFTTIIAGTTHVKYLSSHSEINTQLSFTNCYSWYKVNPYEMNLQCNHLKPLSLHWFHCIWQQCNTEKMGKVQLTAEMINRRQTKGAQNNIWKRKRKLGTSNCSAS